MDLQWTVYVKRSGNADAVPLAAFQRPSVGTATVSDFGLSIAEARQLLVELQRSVAQDQICAYDARRRCCRHCGIYRRIKDWRPRIISTCLGEIRVRVPRVVSCLCLPEPLDDDDEPINHRYSECPIERLVPRRRTPEVSYLCAMHGASVSYRSAARFVADLTGLHTLCHATVRRETVRCGENIEDAQFQVGWHAGGNKRRGAKHLRVSIDGTVVTATPWDETAKFEIIAGPERDHLSANRRYSLNKSGG